MASLLQTLFTFLFKSNSPDAIKKRTMKAIAKRIRSNRNGRFYRTKAKELSPVCGKFFYDIYKAVSIAQVSMPALIKSVGLRSLIIEHFVDREILKKFDLLSPESIEERVKTANPKALADELRKEFDTLTGAIGMATGVQIDSCYNLILSLSQFVSFDYYTLIKRFGFKDREYGFNSIPQFVYIKAEPLIGLLQDFVEYITVIDPSQDWKTALKLLKASRNGSDVINAEQWYKVLLQIQELMHSGILTLIIQHATDNPGWKMQPQIPNERIFSNWLEIKRQSMEDGITKIVTTRWTSQIRELKQMIFGNMAVNPLKYYNDKASDLFAARGFEGLTHTMGLSYLMAFLQEVFTKEIQELCDLLTIQAQWAATSLFLPLAEEAYAAQAFMKQLDDFDESLRNDGMNGSRLIATLVRFERDRSQGRVIKELLTMINNEAMTILLQTTDCLINIAKNVETAKNDYFQDPHILIVNWRELEVASHRNMAKWLQDISNKLEKFIELSRLFIER
jgi:hypothetical protein